MHWKKLLTPAVIGFIAAPALIMWHEFGHYSSAVFFRLQPRLEYAGVKLTSSPEKLKEADVPVTAFGPLMDLLLAAAGIIWLVRVRAHRRSISPTFSEWLATGCALGAGRWLRCFTGTPSHPQPADEAFLSQAMGLPSWVLPYALAPVAIIAIAAVIRLHPEGMRFVPFTVMLVMGIAGLGLWFTVIGPTLLPPS